MKWVIVISMLLTGCASGLERQIKQICESVPGKVGAYATIVETGESAGYHENDSFPMRSVYKLPIAMAVLREVERGNFALRTYITLEVDDIAAPSGHTTLGMHSETVKLEATLMLYDLLRYMIIESDDTACDALLRTIGGPKKVAEFLREIGIDDIAVATTEKQQAIDEETQYRNWAKPEAMVRLLCDLETRRDIPRTHRDFLFQCLIESTSGPHRIKGLLPPETAVAHKTGSSRTVNGMTRATNDVGMITLPDGRHIAIAVFVSDCTADDETRDTVIAKIAKAAWDEWTRPQP